MKMDGGFLGTAHLFGRFWYCQTSQSGLVSGSFVWSEEEKKRGMKQKMRGKTQISDVSEQLLMPLYE